MDKKDLTHDIIGCAIEVHKLLGPGLLESVYEEALCHEFVSQGIAFERQTWVPIDYKTKRLATPLKLDLIVENEVIVENKSRSMVTSIDKKQLLSYLRLSEIKVGLLINFHVSKLVDGVHRVVNGYVK